MKMHPLPGEVIRFPQTDHAAQPPTQPQPLGWAGQPAELGRAPNGRPYYVRPQDWGAFDLAALEGKPVPQRDWIVRDWLPVGQVTINYADGGDGKTLLAMQLMASCATGRKWAGMDVQRCKSIGFFSEDDETELHMRFETIRLRHGVQWPDMADAMPVNRTGKDNMLAMLNRDTGKLVQTAAFQELRARAIDSGARLIVIDTAATTFGGNEINRSEVTQFVGTVLTKLAQDINGAVLLNAHPSAEGMKSGTMKSGSTGWSNSARMRWSLTRPKPPTGEDEDYETDERILTRKKANGASKGAKVHLRWSDGIFDVAGASETPDPLAGANKIMDAERVFLAILAGYPEPVSGARQAGNYAPKIFAKRADTEGHSKPALERAMESLIKHGRIKAVPYGRPSDQRFRLEAVVRKAHDAPEPGGATAPA